MKRTYRSLYGVALCLVGFSVCTSAQEQVAPDASLTTRSVQAVGFQVGEGNTKLDLKGTDLMPTAAGEVKVEIKTKAGRANIDLNVHGMQPPSPFGAEFLTYVVWAVSPEGRTGNMGELLINKDGVGHLGATIAGQTFSIIITAEPYFAVRAPSDVVVMQSVVRKDTKGKIFPVSEYKLMKRGQYQKIGNPLALTPDLASAPLAIYEARNAVDIARSRQADKYAAENFSKAEASLKMAEDALARKAERNAIISAAQQTAQFAEDARAISVQRQDEERIANEREAAAAAAKAEAESKAAAEAAEAQRRADAAAAEAKRKSDEAAAEAKRKADAQIAAEQEARRLAEEQRLAAEREKQLLRAKLLEQFNRVLPTVDTERGLVVNLGDVLFDTAKSDLRPDAREALAKLSGIVLNYSSLRLTIEGHTDSTGSENFNQTLSEQRADSVRTYLIKQGLNADTLSSQGFGMKNPVADNGTAQGRQKNRRVEIIVSGEVIGTVIGSKV